MTVLEINTTVDSTPDNDKLLVGTTIPDFPSKYYVDKKKKYSTDSSDDYNKAAISVNLNDSGVDTTDEPTATGPFISICKCDEPQHSPIPSPRTSPSNSITAADNTVVVNKPTTSRSGGNLYERNLLKKRLIIPDISFDYNSDDVRTDDEVRKISNGSDKKFSVVGYSSENELKTSNTKIRKSSGSKTKGKGDSEPFVASLAVKKFSRGIRSPMFLRKNNSFKQTDSAVSSSNEATTENIEKRKKRKLSLGKRKKSQQLFLAEKAKETQEVPSDTEKPLATKPERSSRKHRRRKQTSKSQNDDLSNRENDQQKTKTSKIILLYSGHATAESPRMPSVSRKNRLETLKKSESFDSYTSENEDYSSACSDLEAANSNVRKQKKRSLTKRFWKSINTLFLAEYQSSNDVVATSTPPVNRKPFKRNGALYSSMPGGLQKINRQNEIKRALEIKNAKDDLSLLKQVGSTGAPTLDTQLQTIESKKDNIKTIEKWERKKKGRSKSVDDLLDQSFTRKLSPEWFEQRKKAHSTLEAPRDRSHSKLLSSSSTHPTKYEIVLSHEPTPHQPYIELSSEEQVSGKDDAMTGQDLKIPTEKDGENIIKSKTEPPLEVDNSPTAQLCHVNMRDLKCVLQRVLNDYLTNKLFQPNEVNNWCRALSESIKERIIQVTEDRLKVVVQVFIGALCDDGIHAAVQSSTGSTNNDGFFTVTYNGQDMFAVASIFTYEL